MPVARGATSLLTPRKVATYGVLSTLAAFAVIVGAFRQRPNFYSAAVMLGRSNGCMMVLFNYGLFLTLCIGKICQKVFFGPLRAVEVEHLYERSWYAVTESLLAMTIFRDEFGANFVFLFGTLLFLKIFHWLSADRVEYMEQIPTVSRLFHVRMVCMLWTLFFLDLFLVAFAIEVLILEKHRMGIMVMFASEFMILSATLWSTIAKYIINVQDARSEEPWEAKSMYVFFVDLITDFLKLMTYLTFFALILSFYGLPLNIIRDVYMTATSFFSKVRDFIQYRAATRNMDTRFPDATPHDLSVMSDGTCIICREEMLARRRDDQETPQQEGASGSAFARDVPSQDSSGGLNETPKKLPCGHIFHFHCLRSWLERQQSCPTCRRTVFASSDSSSAGAANSNDNNVDGRAQAGAVPREEAQTNLEARRRSTRAASREETESSTTQTARDRLQGFLRQLQTDAQRVREQQANQHDPRFTNSQPAQAPPRSTSPLVSGSAPECADRGVRKAEQQSSSSAAQPARRAPMQTALISSLFGQGADGAGSANRSRPEQRDDLAASLVPPPPWTMKPRATDRPTSPRNSERSSLDSDSKTVGTSKSPADTEGKPRLDSDLSESNPSLDPIDAREAARAAALKRFEMQSADSSSARGASSNAPAGTSAKGKGKEEAEEEVGIDIRRKPNLPGNPVLIPLFDASKVPDYDSQFASDLPFPLATSSTPLALSSPSFPRTKGMDQLLPETILQLDAQQLQALSQRSRRGLEERLRLLTRVEGAIGGLVEEMTRALSVLPLEDSVDPVDNSLCYDHSPAELSKGKAPAEGIHRVTTPSPPTNSSP